MTIKDAMVFHAKVNLKQNIKLLERLASLTDAQRNAKHPTLSCRSINRNLDSIIKNSVFQLYQLALSNIDKVALESTYIMGTEESERGPTPVIRSYAQEDFKELCNVMLELSHLYVAAFSSCEETELVSGPGVPPYDFGSMGFYVAQQLRGEIYGVLRAEGFFDEIHPFVGPLIDR